MFFLDCFGKGNTCEEMGGAGVGWVGRELLSLYFAEYLLNILSNNLLNFLLNISLNILLNIFCLFC